MAEVMFIQIKHVRRHAPFVLMVLLVLVMPVRDVFAQESTTGPYALAPTESNYPVCDYCQLERPRPWVPTFEYFNLRALARQSHSTCPALDALTAPPAARDP